MASQPPDHDPIPELGRSRQPAWLLGLCVNTPSPFPLPAPLPPHQPREASASAPGGACRCGASDCCLLTMVVLVPAADPDMLEVGRVAGSLEWNRAHFGYAEALHPSFSIWRVG